MSFGLLVKRPEIRLGESFRMEGLPRDALARLAQNKGLKRYRCASLLGESQYRVAQLEAPSVPPEERVQALRWRLKDMVDFPVDGASIAVADIPAEGSRQANVFAIVAPREVIAERMALFHEARVPLEAIDIPEMAVRNVASLFEEPNRGLAFLVLNSGESLLTITYGGELYLSRRIEFPRRRWPDRRGASPADAGTSGLELQRTLDNFDPPVRLYLGIAFAGVLGVRLRSCRGRVGAKPLFAGAGGGSGAGGRVQWCSGIAFGRASGPMPAGHWRRLEE
jgi:MSHA biogenesis protein MshI